MSSSSSELRSSLIGPPQRCGTEGEVREFNSGLYSSVEGFSKLTVPRYEFIPLNTDLKEARLLRLHPTDDLTAHVRCNLETHSLTDLPYFVAINNARGYRNIQEAIEVDGQALLTSVALERFLRYIRTKIDKPTNFWVRYVCVVELDPQEQATYWTRDFSDQMYAKASQIIDMHEINGHLIENGYFERVFDSRYVGKEKVWSGRDTDEPVILPRVCPVRLGTKPNIEAPTMDYQYMPLDMIADEIRVMCIMPAEDTSAPIVMHAAHCPIRCEAHYIALSYRWGTDETPEQIVLNGQRKTIRNNLAAAIRVLRSKNKIVPMWIDALSINQEDVVERGRQVRRMGHIYDFAMCVDSYTGPADADTEDVWGFMGELARYPKVDWNEEGQLELYEWNFTGGAWSHGKNMIQPDRLVRLWVALYKFLTRQYFRRCWILQEVAWATNPTIVIGRNLGVHFDTLDKAVSQFHDILTREPSIVGEMQAADPSLEAVNVEMLAYPRKIYYFRYLISGGHAGGGIFGGGFSTISPLGKTSPGFLEALVLTRDFECTDPRDHVFALWNLAQDKSGLDFTPDYTKTYEEVYTGFSQAWIEQHGSLDVLGAVEATQETSDFYVKVPSWAPHWNISATASCLVRRDHLLTRIMPAMPDLSGKLYSADGNMTRDVFDSPIVFFEGKTLHCTGLIIDEVGHLFDDAPDIPSGTAPKSRWQAHYWAHAIETYYREQALATYDDPLRAAWAMFHGDSVAAWPPVAESGYSPDQCPANVQYVCLPKLSRHVRLFANSYSPIEARTVADWVLRGRRPFVTENGYMGLAPAYVAESDQGEIAILSIAVVVGCSVPLVLRERENGTYQLVGTCFVQGWMDGEWMETMMGAESPKEFWDAMKDGAQLVIT